MYITNSPEQFSHRSTFYLSSLKFRWGSELKQLMLKPRGKFALILKRPSGSVAKALVPRGPGRELVYDGMRRNIIMSPRVHESKILSGMAGTTAFEGREIRNDAGTPCLTHLFCGRGHTPTEAEHPNFLRTSQATGWGRSVSYSL